MVLKYSERFFRGLIVLLLPDLSFLTSSDRDTHQERELIFDVYKRKFFIK